MKARLLVVLLLSCGAAASAQRPPDGYMCTAETLFGIGGMDAEGVGEVRLTTDAEYRETGAQFSYQVRDRVMGRGRMVATWALADSRSGPFAPIESVWVPFWTPLAATPAAVEISLDEGAPIVMPIANRSWLQIDRDGGVSGLRLLSKAGVAPELRGHRSFGYKVKSAAGEVLAGELFLLP